MGVEEEARGEGKQGGGAPTHDHEEIPHSKLRAHLVEQNGRTRFSEEEQSGKVGFYTDTSPILDRYDTHHEKVYLVVVLKSRVIIQTINCNTVEYQFRFCIL